MEGVSVVFCTTVKVPFEVQFKQLMYYGPVQELQE